MKLKVIRKTKEEVNLKITGATLLSIEEAEALPDHLRRYTNWWWLRSPGTKHIYASYVNCPGYINFNKYGEFVDNSETTIRPALKIENLKSLGLKVGDSIFFDDKEFEVISDTLAFCTTDIGTHCFHEDEYAEGANDYKKSDVKKFIDGWFKRAKKETTSTHNYECICVGCSFGGEDYAEG